MTQEGVSLERKIYKAPLQAKQEGGIHRETIRSGA